MADCDQKKNEQKKRCRFIGGERRQPPSRIQLTDPKRRALPQPLGDGDLVAAELGAGPLPAVGLVHTNAVHRAIALGAAAGPLELLFERHLGLWSEGRTPTDVADHAIVDGGLSHTDLLFA